MREITGYHVFGVTASAFAVIIGVNLLLAWKAVSTFPGVEVASSYAAGIGFDARRAAQEALGWDVTAQATGQSLRVAFRDASGASLRPVALTVAVGRTTEAADDQTALLEWDGAAFTGPLLLAPGLWRVDITARAADGTAFVRQLRAEVAP
jgi:nitrogen fixation protein FixH